MKCFALLILCLISGFSQAQEYKRFAFGLKAGAGWGGWSKYPSYFNFNYSPYLGREIGPQFVSAYAFGISSKYRLPARISVNLDLLYLSGGSRLIDHNRGTNAFGLPVKSINEQTLRVNTLRTPLYLSWDVTKWQARPIISMGASYNRIVGGHRNVYSYLSTTGETQDETQLLLLDIPSNRDLVHDLSFYAAVGLNIKDRLLLEANLWLGPLRSYYFANIRNIPISPDSNIIIDYYPPIERTYHNRAILVTLTYLFIGK